MDAKTKKKLMDALAAMAAAPSPVTPIKDDDFLFVPFYDKNRPHPDPLPTATGNRIQFDNYSRGQRPGRVSFDEFAKDFYQTTPMPDIICTWCSGDGMRMVSGGHIPCPHCSGIGRLTTTPMPTLYPTLKRRGLIVELTLPDATPARVVMELATRVSIKKIDDYRCEFPYKSYDIVQGILVAHFGHVNEESESEVDPHAPLELFIEYVGACRSRPDSSRNVWGQQARTCNYCGGSGLNPYHTLSCMHCGGQGRITQSAKTEAYASAWVDGGWNCILPERALKEFFGEPAKAFDGNFHRVLLESTDVAKAYKRLARQFHPDLNKAKDATEQFRRLRQAFDDLKDPLRKKRYEAGLKFQTSALTKAEQVVFRVPKSNGRVVVLGTWNEPYRGASKYGGAGVRDQRVLTVSKILSWSDIFDDRGRVMCSTWSGGSDESADFYQKQHGMKLFTITWEDTTEFEINI